MYSEALSRFTDPSAIEDKQALRAILASHVEAFLAKGGRIQQIPPEVSGLKTKVNPTNAEMIAWRKKFQRNYGRPI